MHGAISSLSWGEVHFLVDFFFILISHLFCKNDPCYASFVGDDSFFSELPSRALLPLRGRWNVPEFARALELLLTTSNQFSASCSRSAHDIQHSSSFECVELRRGAGKLFPDRIVSPRVPYISRSA